MASNNTRDYKERNRKEVEKTRDAIRIAHKTRHDEQKQSRKQQMTMTRKQKERQRKKRIRRNVRVAAIIGSAALLSMGSFRLGQSKQKELDAAKTEISIDLEKAQNTQEINIENALEGNKFKDSLSVNVDGYTVDEDELTQNERIENQVSEEINSLKNSDEVLEYIKSIYVTEYNERNNENITTDNVRLKKRRGEVLYVSKAENGDTIIRSGSDTEEAKINDTETGLLTVLITKEDGSVEIENAFNYNGEYVTVYHKDEEVAQAEETALTELGNIINDGIDYNSAFTDTSKNEVYNGKEENAIYKDRLIQDIVSLKKEQIENVINSSINKINESTDEER